MDKHTEKTELSVYRWSYPHRTLNQGIPVIPEAHQATDSSALYFTVSCPSLPTGDPKTLREWKKTLQKAPRSASENKLCGYCTKLSFRALWTRDASGLPASLPRLLPCNIICLQNTTAMCLVWCFFQDTIDITGTFKYRKVTLVEEGFNPEVIKDSLYFLDDKAAMYVPMTEDIYNAISNKSLKLWICPWEHIFPDKT